MTIRARNRALAAGIVIGIAALAVTLLPMIASSELDKGREVQIVIRDMAFYLDGKGEPNPTLLFHAGERVRLVVRSEDAGMDHDFVVKKWKVKSKMVHGRDTTRLTFKVPRRAGAETYYCTPHAGKMRGTIRVE